MPRYLIQAAYTPDAVATLVRSPQERQTGLRTLLERLGAQLETFDYSLGDYDIATIMTAPDNATAVAVAMAIQAAGHIKTFKTTPLLTQDEFLTASQKASGADYQAPTDPSAGDRATLPGYRLSPDRWGGGSSRTKPKP